MKIALIFGGESVEHEVSIRSARTVYRALVDAGYQVIPFAVNIKGEWLDAQDSNEALQLTRINKRAPKTNVKRIIYEEIDVAFPLIHGTSGEDGTIQGFLEIAGIPYVGPDFSASSIAFNKDTTKRLLNESGVKVVPWVSFDKYQPFSIDKVREVLGSQKYFFVKPATSGSSVGVRKCSEEDIAKAVKEALLISDKVLVETAVSAREIECSIMGYPEVRASQPGEIIPGREFYDYRDKYIEEKAQLKIPAPLPQYMADKIKMTAIKAVKAIGVHSMARVDFLLTDEEIYVNEINTIPGFTSISMYPKLWEISGVPIKELVSSLVKYAVASFEDRKKYKKEIERWIEKEKSQLL